MRRSFLAASLLSSAACTRPPAPVHELRDDAKSNPTASASLEQPPSSYRFAFVTLGGRSRTGFHEAVDKRGPALLGEVWVADVVPKALAPTIERAFGDEEQRWAQAERGSYDHSVVLERHALARLGFEPPGEPLWLIGPDGPCRADYGEPVLSWYTWGLDAFELSWRLNLHDSRPGCELRDPESWSQIAVIAASLPSDLRFVRAELLAAQRVEPAQWSSPHAAIVQAAVADVQRITIDEVWVREVVVPGIELVELTIALVERHRPPPGQPPEPCMDYQHNVVVVGRMRDGEFEQWPVGGPREWSQLRGAFVRSSTKRPDELLWTVHESLGQAWVVAPELEPPATRILTAIFHEEDFGEPPFSQTEYCGP